MSWWPFGGSQTVSETRTTALPSEFDAQVPPPPSGVTIEAPVRPRSVKSESIPEFKGFTPPQRYEDADFSKYTSPASPETPDFNFGGYGTGTSAEEDPAAGLSFADKYIENPRVRACYESMKMGAKMGGTVGGIFGGLTGLYASIVHRSPLLLPLSFVGGGISFGFFLACGMLVRCEPQKRLTAAAPLESNIPIYILPRKME